jgi:hypothetical protein
MTYTRDKLNEAKYFLEEMRIVSYDPDKFRYSLTAFLAASRSITLIMQKEFSKKTGFTDWYAPKRREMVNNPTLKYLYRQRNISQHERPVLQYPISIIEQSVNSMGGKFILSGTGNSIDLSSDLITLPVMQPTTPVTYCFDDMRSKDVIIICQEAITALEAIVVECETKFAIN